LQAARERLIDGHCCRGERSDAECHHSIMRTKKLNVIDVSLGEQRLRASEDSYGEYCRTQIHDEALGD
jgi:hypothetical protein